MRLKRKLPTVKERIPRLNGIFSHMKYEFPGFTSLTLDTMFFANYSLKNTSQLVEIFDFEENGQLTDESLTTLSAILLEMFKPKWDKLKGLHSAEYDPLHNYLDEWEDKSDGTKDFDGKNVRSDDFSDVRTDDLKENRTYSGNNNETDSTYAFNSVNAVPTDSMNGGDSGTETVTNDGSVTVNKTGTRTDTMDQDTTLHEERKGKHFGNIGNITTQQLIREEISTWQWNFMEEVLKDVMSQLTIPIYS